MRCDTIWRDARLLTMVGPGLDVIGGGLVAARDGRVVYAGPADAAPALDAGHIVDCAGRLVTPGLVDCHTHIVHAGNRAREFEMRLAGASYEEIARTGGGIVSTTAATRAASVDALIAETLPRLDALIGDGVTTIEVKSGYGLALDAERRQLQAARQLADHRSIRVSTSFLGAHAVPAEYRGRADDYVELVCTEMLPALAAEGLVDAVDGFCETIGFTPAQITRVFDAARALGLPVRLHAEQLSNAGGSALAARYGALSADHLEHLDAAGVAALAAAGTVAVLLPGAFYFMRETQRPPIAALRAAGVPIAIATDCNPGTSPLSSLLMAMNMGATLFGLTVEECWRGVTVNAARALGLADEIGTLEAGKACDLAIWNAGTPAELISSMGLKLLHARIRSGA